MMLTKVEARGEPGDKAYWDDAYLEAYLDEFGKIPAPLPVVADSCGRIVVWVREKPVPAKSSIAPEPA